MSILMVTGIEGARNCAAVVGAQLGMEVEVAEGRKAALAALRRREFLAVVVDETLAECDPAAAEDICEQRRPGHSPADQLCPLGRGAADPRDSRRAAPPRARADAGPPRRCRRHRDRAEDHGGGPAAALATGAQRRRGRRPRGRKAAHGGRSGRQPAPAVERAARDRARSASNALSKRQAAACQLTCEFGQRLAFGSLPQRTLTILSQPRGSCP